MTSRRSVKSCPREAPRGTHEELYYGPVSPADPESPRDDFRRGAGPMRARPRGEVRFLHYDEAGYALYRDSSSDDDESRDTARPRRSASVAGSHGPGPARAPPPPGGPVGAGGRSHAPPARTPKMTRGAPKASATPATDPARGRRPAQADSAVLLDAPAPTASGRTKTPAQGLAKKLHFSTAPPSPRHPPRDWPRSCTSAPPHRAPRRRGPPGWPGSTSASSAPRSGAWRPRTPGWRRYSCGTCRGRTPTKTSTSSSTSPPFA
uniref:Tegument protein VP22 n=1 Tax=Human herpesvirus 2 TaxID=10310 RepID=A0A0Y0RF91_HHV2|nr:tegument protein VP22 [Human alphaherpesvirus 2]